MILGIIATDEGGGIGYNNSMPWPKNTEDMKWFREVTTSNVVVMGRKTWESDMPTPLPNRVNVVVTRGRIDGIITMSGDLPHELKLLQHNHSTKHICVIGGADILLQSLPAIERLYVTHIPGKWKCDTVIDNSSLLDNFTMLSSRYLTTCRITTYASIQHSTQANS